MVEKEVEQYNLDFNKFELLIDDKIKSLWKQNTETLVSVQ